MNKKEIMPKYIYRIADPQVDEKMRFYAENDREALQRSERLGASIWATVMLIGEIDYDQFGSYSKIYPYETAVSL